jgi:ParB-like chromosome segregation protein Spo0J
LYHGENVMAASKQSTAAVFQAPKLTSKRKVSALKAYPRQDVMFHSLTGAEFDRLKGDIERNGLERPIEITTDNVIIDGHQRWRAVGELGWDELRVWIRDDLVGDQIERRHLDANRNRRQLDMLDQVRLEVRLFELEKKRPPGGLGDWQLTEFKEHVAKAIGKTRRHTQRLLNVLEAPMVIQRAYSEGRLRIELAEKVRRLGAEVQSQIASDIDAGGDPTELVGQHLKTSLPKPKAASLGDMLGQLVAELESGMETLKGKENKISRSADELSHDIEVLSQFLPYGKDLMRTLTAKKAQELEDQKAVNAAVAKAFAEFGSGSARPPHQQNRGR